MFNSDAHVDLMTMAVIYVIAKHITIASSEI